MGREDAFEPREEQLVPRCVCWCGLPHDPRHGDHRRLLLASRGAGNVHPATVPLVPFEGLALEGILPWRARLRSSKLAHHTLHGVMELGHTPVCGLFLILSALLPGLESFWFLEITMVHHPIEGFLTEREVPDALVHHPRESYIGDVAWYVVAVPSSDIRVHTGEPALFKVLTPVRIFVARRDVPQGWREWTATFV